MCCSAMTRREMRERSMFSRKPSSCRERCRITSREQQNQHGGRIRAAQQVRASNPSAVFQPWPAWAPHACSSHPYQSQCHPYVQLLAHHRLAAHFAHALRQRIQHGGCTHGQGGRSEMNLQAQVAIMRMPCWQMRSLRKRHEGLHPGQACRRVDPRAPACSRPSCHCRATTPAAASSALATCAHSARPRGVAEFSQSDRSAAYRPPGAGP